MAVQPTTGSASTLPLDLIAQAIPRLSRHDLEALAERLIDKLDTIDAPSDDMEDDDPSGQCDEDGINTGPVFHVYGQFFGGPGCAISEGGY